MSSDSSEAKQVPPVTDLNEGPDVGPSPVQQADPEIFAEKIPINSLPPQRTSSGHGDETLQTTTSGGPAFLERTASFFFKILLIGVAFFATGAAITVTVLMDLLDLKTGWIKTLLQFIKEASKFII